jgi:hypothetical protein
MGQIQVHILSVFEEKGGGYTVVAEVRPDTDITSEEIWRAGPPGRLSWSDQDRPGVAFVLWKESGVRARRSGFHKFTALAFR